MVIRGALLVVLVAVIATNDRFGDDKWLIAIVVAILALATLLPNSRP
jgi:hypothetical protein